MPISPPIAVLTGDIVGSTTTSAEVVSQALESLQSCAQDIAAHRKSATLPRFTRFRGDGWQCYFDTPSLAPSIAMTLLARLRSMDLGLETRLAIGIGPYAYLGSTDLSDASGVAFERSGRALDKMPKQARLDFAWDRATPMDHVALTLLEERASKWSQEQAEALAHRLSPDAPTQASIAKCLGISPQAVSYRLTSAGAPAVEKAIRLWEGEIARRLGLEEENRHD